MKTAAPKLADILTGRPLGLQPLLVTVGATLAAAFLVSVLPPWGGLPFACIALAVVSGRWAALARWMRVAPARMLLLGGATLALGFSFLWLASPWRPLMLLLATGHGLLQAWLIGAGGAQHVVAYSSVAGLAVMMFLILLNWELATGQVVADQLTTSWDQWTRDFVAQMQEAASLTAPLQAPVDFAYGEALDMVGAMQVLGTFLALFVALSVVLAGYYNSLPLPYNSFALFKASERQAPLIITALAAEAIRSYLDLPRLQPYTLSLLYLVGALSWLQAVSVGVFLSKVGARLRRPGLTLLGIFGILLVILQPLMGAIAGLLDIYFDFRKLNRITKDQQS